MKHRAAAVLALFFPVVSCNSGGESKGLQTMHGVHTNTNGCTTSVCVESTVRDAMFRGYSPVVPEDCTAEPTGHDLPGTNHEASLLVIQRVLELVSNSAEFSKALREKPDTKGRRCGKGNNYTA